MPNSSEKSKVNTISLNGDKISDEQFRKISKVIVKQIKSFNAHFTQFLDQERKSAKELWNQVVMYNNVNSGGPLHDPTINIEHLLQYFLVNIQDKTKLISNSLLSIKAAYDDLPQLKLTLERSSQQLNWDPTENPAIRGTIQSRSPSELLEDIADIIHQFDIAISCIFHYHAALDLKLPRSYENLLNSFTISAEFSSRVNQFLVKHQNLLS